MLNLSRARRAFNRAARTAKLADVLPREIADRFMERLPIIRLQPQRVLDCGAFSGCLTQQLQRYYPKAEIIAVDFAEKQLANFEDCARAAAHYTSLPFPDNTFDMITSSLALHWTNDLATCFREFKRVLKPNGLFMMTMLGVQTLLELRQSFSDCYEFLHRFPDMHDIGDLLLQTGFDQPVMDMEVLTIRYKKLRTLFEDFKFSGASNAHNKRPKGLFGKTRWHAAHKYYETLKDEDAYYPATFEIIYGHAWNASDKGNTDTVSESVISFPAIES